MIVEDTSGRVRLATSAACLLVLAASASAGLPLRVANDTQLRLALRRPRAGTLISIAPGNYRGGIYVRGAAGTEREPIVIEGRDPNRPPVFHGGAQALHLSDCSYVTLRHLVVKGFPRNGINVDDGGTYKTPAHHITIEFVAFLDTGPRGNLDGLKMSGVDRFAVRNCRFEGWGGSAIDMVGCHHGVVEDCRFTGKRGFSQANAVQMKGGTTNVLVQTSFFEKAGQRAINLGGSTGLRYFRPKLDDYEAKDITVAGNRFVGGMAPIAWVTAHGGHVHHNTIYNPDAFVLRILQENAHVRQLKPCHDGLFEHNLIVCTGRLREVVNIGPKTAPQTFTFRHNAWYLLGRPPRPRLPAAETDGVYRVDPKLKGPGTAEMKVTSTDPRLKGIGAGAYEPPKKR